VSDGGSTQRQRLAGQLRPPGDKSTTHRGLLLGALARGTTVLRRGLDCADTRSTAALVQALGAQVAWSEAQLTVVGHPEPLVPALVLDCGNSGTTARLATGLLAGRQGTWTLDGDDSLRGRPMGRVLQPLRSLGADVLGDKLPFTVRGAPLSGGEVSVEVPSAQVKSALLLAGLSGDGPLTVVQHVPTRDHTERMLPAFGAKLDVQPGAVTVRPSALEGATVDVPADPSAAAFMIVGALLLPGSELVLQDVGLWPRRTGFLRALDRAGADIEVLSRSGGQSGADPRGDLAVRATRLRAFDITPADVPDLVDEVPVLALAAALAEGTSRFAGLAELRLKESDRVAAVAELLVALGVTVELSADALTIEGRGELSGVARCDHHDHRLAMTATVARLVSGHELPGEVPAAAISWPGFLDALRDGVCATGRCL